MKENIPSHIFILYKNGVFYLDRMNDLFTTIELQNQRMELVKDAYLKGKINGEIMKDNLKNANDIIDLANERIRQIQSEIIE